MTEPMSFANLLTNVWAKLVLNQLSIHAKLQEYKTTKLILISTKTDYSLLQGFMNIMISYVCSPMLNRILCNAP